MTFHINHKAYTVDIGDDIDKKMEDSIKKYVDLDRNIDTRELLIAYLKKTYDLLALEESLEELSKKIDEIEI